MLPGPIFAVEMLTGARRSRYIVVRTIYAGILFLALAWMYYESVRWSNWGSIQQAASFMANFFYTFGTLQLAVVLALGPAIAAGTIAVERERRTIEYLFVSDLSNSEIVFGKLAARVLQTVAIVLAGIPILAVAMLMGGISPESLLVLTILTVSTVAMVAVFSITVSVWSNTTRDAVMRAYVILAALLIVPPCVWAGLAGSAFTFPAALEWVNNQFLLINPFWVFYGVTAGVSSSTPGDSWLVLGAMVRNHALIAVAGAVLSAWSVRRVRFAERTASPRRLRWLPRLRPGIGDRPMLWKELFSNLGTTKLGLAGRIALGLILLVILGTTLYQFAWATSIALSANRSWYLEYAITMTAFVNCGVLLLIAARAASSITSEKERDAWVSLLSTPLGAAEIVGAKVAGNVWAARWLFAVEGVILGLALAFDLGFLIAIFFTAATTLLLSVFASSLGVLSSLVCRTSLRAMGMTIAIGVFVGGGYLFCCIPLFVGVGDEGIIFFSPCMPFLMAIPGIMYVQAIHGYGHNEPAMVAAYLFGIAGYSVATVALISTMIGNFEQWVGRCVHRSLLAPVYVPSAKPPSPIPSTPVAAEPAADDAS